MGAVLLAVVWSTVRTIHSASDTVIRGEAETLGAAVRAKILGPGPDDLATRLEIALDNHESDGLRYVAAFDGDGDLLAAAGASSADPRALAAWALRAAPGAVDRVGDRVRVNFRRQRGGGGRNAFLAGGRRDDDPPARSRPPVVVLELVPRVADELDDTARRLLAVGILAALTLTGLAAVLVRWSLGREEAVRTMEQARRLATLGQMSAVLAHEIRNPLASLKGNSQLLAGMLPEGDRARAKADRVVDEAIRLETLSNDLLAFARDGDLRPREVDPAALVREAALATGGDRITVDDAGAPRSWRLDPDKMRQVLVNLLENAAEAGGGPIEARVARDGRSLVIAIRDHGPGIAEADLPRIFEPFFTRRIHGTGLGLAVAKRMVDLHGGTLTARNAAGDGAELLITLPRA